MIHKHKEYQSANNNNTHYSTVYTVDTFLKEP